MLRQLLIDDNNYIKKRGPSVTSVSSQTSIPDGGLISIDNTETRQVIIVAGDSSAVTLGDNTFSGANLYDGMEIILIGNSDVNTVTIQYKDSPGGCVGNFSTITINKYKVVKFIWSQSLDRFVFVSES